MGQKIRCPRITCRSYNVEPVMTKRKMSLGKAAIGGLAFGGFGALAGAAIGKTGKTTFLCKDCNHTFEVKL